MARRWTWIEKGPYGSADASVMSKLFKNQVTDRIDSLSRETLQNSWDAADDTENFKMVFRFEEYTGDKKRLVADALGLQELREYESTSCPMKFPSKSALYDQDGSSKPLKILYVEDYGAHGLRGPIGWQSGSELFRAIYDLGNSNKNASAGGSYGFGKSAMFGNSQINMVCAYSAFEPGFANPEHDAGAPAEIDPISRRYVGFAYWTGHTSDGRKRDGRAMLAAASGSLHKPFEDAEADTQALRVGIRPRNPRIPTDRGTTFAIIDHAVEPSELLQKIEENWWPAMEQFGLRIEIKAGGKTLTPDPFKRPELVALRRALALAMDGTPGDSEWKWTGATDPGFEPFEVIRPGTLAIIKVDSVTQGGLKEPAGAKIARVRGTRMLVDYLKVPSAHALRGIYVASDDHLPSDPGENFFLRLAENAAHDNWARRAEANADDKRPWQLANLVVNRIETAVYTINKELAQDVQDSKIKSSLIAEYLPFGGDDPGQDERTKEPEKGHFTFEAEDPDLVLDEDDPEFVRAVQGFTLHYRPLKRKKSANVNVRAWCVIVEDGAGGDRIPMTLESDDAEVSGNELRITMSKTKNTCRFTATSEGYDSRWSAKIVPEAEIARG